jgi:drug/metabolite transporter (DMT)-like permease
VVILCYVVCALVWGTTWFVIRESIAGFPVFLAAALRFTVASIILWAMLAAGIGRPLPRGRRLLTLLVAAGLLNGIGYLLVYAAEQRLPGGLMAVLFGTIPLVTAVFATVLKIEAVSRAQVVSALVALIGIAVISYDRMSVGVGEALSVAAALAAVIASVGYSVLVKRASAGVSPLAMTAIFLTVTTLVSWAAALPEVDRMPWPLPLQPTLATLYLAVLGSVVAFGCYFYLLKHVSLMVANSLVLVQPIIALLVDAAFESRATLSAGTWLGIAITLAAVAVNLLVKARAARLAQRPA